MTNSKATLILILQLATIAFVFCAPALEFGMSRLSLNPPFFYLAFGLILILFGVYLFLTSLFTMSSNFEIRAKQRTTSKLVTDWPFSWVRNPIYLAGGFICLGWSLFFQSKLALLGGIILMVILLIKIRFEEYFLKQQFGKDYLNYIKRVPRIWPSNWRFKSKK